MTIRCFFTQPIDNLGRLVSAEGYRQLIVKLTNDAIEGIFGIAEYHPAIGFKEQWVVYPSKTRGHAPF
jgi:hypothetical protein